jgi:hypothetical protein
MGGVVCFTHNSILNTKWMGVENEGVGILENKGVCVYLLLALTLKDDTDQQKRTVKRQTICQPFAI